MQQKILITGATGFLGFEVVRLLSERGVQPRVLIRRPHRAALLSSFDVEPIQGDLTLPKTLERAVEGVDAVIHLGGRASFESYKRLKPTIVDGTLDLARAAAFAGVENFVFASSLFVYGEQASPIDLETAAVPEMGYGLAKLEAERGLYEIGDASGMSVANLRLPHVYGPQSILFRQVRSGLALFPGGMDNQCGQLHVIDAARAVVGAVTKGWTGSAAVADMEIVTWREYFNVLETHYPYFRLFPLPKLVGYLGASVLEPALSRRDRPTLYTKDTVTGFNLNVPVEPGLVWNDIGLEPRYQSVRDGIPAALDGYVHYRWRHPILDRRSR